MVIWPILNNCTFIAYPKICRRISFLHFQALQSALQVCKILVIKDFICQTSTFPKKTLGKNCIFSPIQKSCALSIPHLCCIGQVGLLVYAKYWSPEVCEILRIKDSLYLSSSFYTNTTFITFNFTHSQKLRAFNSSFMLQGTSRPICLGQVLVSRGLPNSSN